MTRSAPSQALTCSSESLLLCFALSIPQCELILIFRNHEPKINKDLLLQVRRNNVNCCWGDTDRFFRWAPVSVDPSLLLVNLPSVWFIWFHQHNHWKSNCHYDSCQLLQRKKDLRPPKNTLYALYTQNDAWGTTPCSKHKNSLSFLEKQWLTPFKRCSQSPPSCPILISRSLCRCDCHGNARSATRRREERV